MTRSGRLIAVNQPHTLSLVSRCVACTYLQARGAIREATFVRGRWRIIEERRRQITCLMRLYSIYRLIALTRARVLFGSFSYIYICPDAVLCPVSSVDIREFIYLFIYYLKKWGIWFFLKRRWGIDGQLARALHSRASPGNNIIERNSPPISDMRFHARQVYFWNLYFASGHMRRQFE